MYFLIDDNVLLEKYNTTRDKVSTDIKKEIDGEPVYNEEFLKTKIKSHADQAPGFYDKKISRLVSKYTSLPVISLDFAFQKDENDYLGLFLKNFKYIEKKVIRHINNNLSDFSSSDESDEE